MNTRKMRAEGPTKLQYWTELLGKYEASGMTQREFARAHKVGTSSLSKWLTKLRRLRSVQSPQTANGRLSPRLVPVEVLQTPTSMCELALIVGTFRFAPSIHTEQLRALLSVLTTARAQ